MNYYQASVYSSTSNSRYKNFYTNVFSNSLGHRNELILASSSNIFYQIYMGIKYIYSNYDVIGYEKIDNKMYKNDNVLPMFYVSYNTFNEDYFNSIKYPYNMEVLLNNVVTNNSNNKTYTTNIEEYNLSYKYKENKNLSVQKQDNMYYVNASKDLNITLDLDEVLKNKILIITFRVNNQHRCSLNDSEIKINNIVNKLTCNRELYQNNNYVFHYVISSNEDISKLNINFKKGLYIIEDIKSYIIDYDYIKNVKNNITEARVNKKNTKGDVIELDVEATKDGYFVTTLPYDKGYTIYIDGIKVNYEKINTSFIGFKINSGKHNIKIVYQSNGLLIGKILSIIGLISVVFYVFVEKYRNGKK